MQTNQSKLLDRIEPSILGLIWVTREPLSKRPYHFDTIDYLLEGMLTTHNNKEAQNKNTYGNNKSFFIGTSFGKPLFISHLLESSHKLKEEVYELTELATRKSLGRSSFLVIEPSQLNLSQKLSSKFKDLNFIQLKSD